MNRRKKMSALPGSSSTSDPNEARPNDSTEQSASSANDAREFASRQQRTNATINPTPASTVITGRRPWSSSWPLPSQPSTLPAP